MHDTMAVFRRLCNLFSRSPYEVRRLSTLARRNFPYKKIIMVVAHNTELQKQLQVNKNETFTA